MNRHARWWPLAPSTALVATRPLARRLLGVPIVLFRDRDGAPRALRDLCPHRHAPLSAGAVIDGEVRCPYHGWRFDAAGRCRHIPGLAAPLRGGALVDAFECQEAHGLVWVQLAPGTDAPQGPSPTATALDRFLMQATAVGDLAAVAENFLDGAHTHFVHPGLVRRDGGRQRVRAQAATSADAVEVRYHGERGQDGFISRWFEPARSHSLGRFRRPGIAELEYHGFDRVHFQVTAYLTPVTDDETAVHAWVGTARGLAPAWLKRAVLRPLFAPVLAQDLEILRRRHLNRCAHEKAGGGALGPGFDTRVDLVAPHLRRLLADETPLEVGTGPEVELEL